MNTRTEQAVIFAAPGRAELQETPADARPLGPHEVAGRTLVSLISRGTELAVYQGQLRNGRFPCGSGYAAVFEVEAAGGEVQTLATGDRAFCMGPHRSVQRCHEREAIALPEGLSPRAAVFARMMGISMSTLATTSARPPAKVLVTGLGLVGHLAARIFDLCGYDVIACDPADSRRALAASAGLRHVAAAVPLDDPEVAGRVALALECSGREQAVLDACRVVRKRGEVVLVGVPWVRTAELPAHDILYAVFHNYAVLRSGWEWELPLHDADFRTNSLFGNFAAALDWLAEGRICVDGLYDLAAPRDAQVAYQGLLHGRTDKLTVLFDWTGP